MSELALALQSLDRDVPSDVDVAFSRWYPELKKLAHARLQMAGGGRGMQTTALVHDAYLRLVEVDGLRFGDRQQFLAYASRALRHLIVDIVREQRAQRRGGDQQSLTLDTAIMEDVGTDLDIERVSAALDELAMLDPVLARLVELRFFAGLTALETGELLGISERSVQREWRKARALLLTILDSG